MKKPPARNEPLYRLAETVVKALPGIIQAGLAAWMVLHGVSPHG